MTRAYIAVGSNLGDRAENLARAATLLDDALGVRVSQQSLLYETEPVGGPPQGKFFNGAWEIETSRSAGDLWNLLQAIEKQLGRTRGVKNGPRTVDLDLLFFGDEVFETPSLCIPHPRLHERLFVLRPLAEIAPNLIHPLQKRTVQKMLESVHENVPQS